MKVLHLTKKYPNALGGDAVVVSNLQKQQRAAGYEVVIVTSNCDEIITDEHVYKFGLKDTPANLDAITPKRLLSLLMLGFCMFGILHKERPDIMHTHSIDMAFFASWAARFYHIPMIHTFHIVTFYAPKQSLIRKKSELWLAWHARLRSITAPNAYDVNKLLEAGVEQAVWLPNGVDLAFWKTDRLGGKNKLFSFVAVGRLEHQKGYEYLIKAAALLMRRAAGSFRITIVGDGSQSTVLHGLIRKLQLKNTVKLVGRKTPEEIRSLFAHTDAAVLPSLYEAMSITLLEIWAAELPVIATSVGILREAPADFGAAFIVPPKDEQALAHTMNQCMNDAQKRKLVARKGYEEAKKYAWPVIARKVEAIYRGPT